MECSIARRRKQRILAVLLQCPGDIDAAAKRVNDNGGKIYYQGPQQVPGRGQWIVQAADPQGAAFATPWVEEVAGAQLHGARTT